MIFIGDKAGVVLFVEDLLEYSSTVCQSITIMPQGKSEDCFVLIATDILSEGTVEAMAQTYSLRRITTSWLTIQVG